MKDPQDQPGGAAAPLTIGQCATLACLLEAIAPKPGNVHRGADFEGLTFADLAAAAVAVGPPMNDAHRSGVGAAVLAAVNDARRLTGTNANLGIALLLAPLAAAAKVGDPIDGVGDVLRGMTPDDARLVYEAIQLARPGGMGRVDQMDVAGPPPDDLLSAMRAADDYDLVARQYSENFVDIAELAAPWLAESCRDGLPLSQAIVHTQMRLLAHYPDSLIARKCGLETAQRASHMAQTVLDCGEPGSEAYQQRLADLDFWLRADHHRRNPGTTADLIAAALFVNLRRGEIRPPLA